MEMVDLVDDLKSPRSIESKDFPNLEMLDARMASALNKIQSGGTLSSERRQTPSWKTDRLHDLRLLPCYWRS